MRSCSVPPARSCKVKLNRRSTHAARSDPQKERASGYREIKIEVAARNSGRISASVVRSKATRGHFLRTRFAAAKSCRSSVAKEAPQASFSDPLSVPTAPIPAIDGSPTRSQQFIAHPFPPPRGRERLPGRRTDGRAWPGSALMFGALSGLYCPLRTGVNGVE
jgi:hypothetical protein